MRPQIDVGDRALEQREHRALDAGRVAGEREHRSVVRRVGRVVEQAHAVHARGSRRPSPRRSSGRRPSLTLGTHSISMQCTILDRDALYIRNRDAIIRAVRIVMSDPLRTDALTRDRRRRRNRIATRRSSSSCSPASTITSPPSTSRRSTSGRARCFSIAATRARAPTSSARAARWPSGSASPRSCCRTASPPFSAATATRRAGCCRRRSTAARRRTKRSRCSIG